MAVIQHDPTRDLPSNIFKKKTVKHYSAITDPVKLGQLLNDIDNYNGSFQVLQALRLAPYIFLRPGELASLKWAYIDFTNNQIKLPPSVMKMKMTHIVPLTKKTTQILRECEAVSYESPYVFPSNTSPKTRHITPESLRGGLRRMGYTNEEITTHGFRGIASTLLHEQGFNTDYIERQLAHQERNKIKGAYNHAEHLSERKAMMKDWSDFLDHLMG
jgi:integrase